MPAVRRSPSARIQAAYNTVYRSTLGAPADQPLPCAGISALRFMLPSCHLRHDTSRHDRLRPFHVAYGRSQRSMAGSPMRGLINHGSRSKHKVLQKTLPPPLPWLAHLCSLTHTLPPLSQNLCSYYHPVTFSFDGYGYSSFLFSFGSGLGVRDPRPRIGIVICPLFPFWRARVVLCESTLQVAHLSFPP